MHRRTDFAHGHERENFSLQTWDLQGRSSHFNDYFRALPFAGAKDYGISRGSLMHRLATAVCRAPKIELATPQLA
jgi:hypothetical protein